MGVILDWIMAIVLAVVSVPLLLGKGDWILLMINGKRRTPNKKRTTDEKIRYSRAMGIFVAILAIDEALIAIMPDKSWMMVMNMVIAVVDIAWMVIYNKKFKW